jgi:hypothetical protein
MMLSTEEVDLGLLLVEFSEDSQSLEALIIDEIERSLPDIISKLKIPPLSNMHHDQLLEFRLAGRPGFRRLNSSERETAARQLEHEKFLGSLRKVQEAFSNGILAGTSKRSETLLTDSSDGDKVSVASASHIVHTRDTPTPESSSRFDHETIKTVFASAGSHVLQGDLPFDVSETPMSKTVRDEEDLVEPALEIPDIPIELQEPLANRDIRDLFAVIKADKLVSFLDSSVKSRTPKGVRKIRVPNTRIYAALNLDRLIEKYHGLAVSEELTQDADDELRLLDSLIGAMEHEAQWSRINTRRFHLINKKHSIGLQGDEEKELDTLDKLAERQMYMVQDLPFAELAMLKTYARRLGFEEDLG